MLNFLLSLLFAPTLLVGGIWMYEQFRESEGRIVMPLEWGAINTGLILALGGYVWRQMRKVDILYQALFGVEGRNGVLRRIEKLEATAEALPDMLREGRHGLRNEMQIAVTDLRNDLLELRRELKP